METVLQFGAGNFLRAFVDTFVSEMNAAGQKVGEIVVVQSTGDGDRARQLNAQGGLFHVVVRGLEGGVSIDRVQEVRSISRALTASAEWAAVVAAACAPALHAVVSNTTEAGFALYDADSDAPQSEVAPRSYPAKLLALLRARFEAGENGPVILPCELIAANADHLRECVGEQATRWRWTERSFTGYLDRDCVWVNTLVDRIVPGRPADHPLLAQDPLLTVAEPFAFWAVEDHPRTAWLGGHPAIVRVPDVAPYALRKLRLLNGAHSALVAHVQATGRDDITLVRQAVTDPSINAWLCGLLFEEIVPTVEDRAPDAYVFAESVLERFANPFLDHRLADIATNHAAKIAVRLAPTRDEYHMKLGREPVRLNQVLGNP